MARCRRDAGAMPARCRRDAGAMPAPSRSSSPKRWETRLPPCWCAAMLVRLRAGRCFYADPTAQSQTGRPCRHGHQVAGEERAGDAPHTWPPPADELTVEDEPYDRVRVRAGERGPGCIPRRKAQQAQQARQTPQRDARGRRPIVRGTLLVVAVSRLPQQTRQPQALWLW
jgi:hypothetical protein